ncbi:hypothetical protein WDA79_09480 [Streptomyces sp. A475]|uniref:hypothetical protein n=1 Tax=Streptomyces sp. A475 TaxID=3131976 RepID=UPI0030C92B37
MERHPLLGDGIRSRVGVVNVPLPALLNAIVAALFLVVETAEDDGSEPLPDLLGIAARRPWSRQSRVGKQRRRQPFGHGVPRASALASPTQFLIISGPQGNASPSP